MATLVLCGLGGAIYQSATGWDKVNLVPYVVVGVAIALGVQAVMYFISYVAKAWAVAMYEAKNPPQPKQPDD